MSTMGEVTECIEADWSGFEKTETNSYLVHESGGDSEENQSQGWWVEVCARDVHSHQCCLTSMLR